MSRAARSVGILSSLRRALLATGVLAALGSPAWAWAGTVAIDVGHTRAEPGAISARGVPEFDFNLRLATTLQQALADAGVATRLINGDGTIGSLAERAMAADGAALLLSIHHDSVQPAYLRTWRVDGHDRSYSDRYRGYSLFVSRRNVEAAGSLACASAIGASLRAEGFQPSRYHAKAIAGENRPFADEANGVHDYDGLVVLRTATMPAVLIEAGVIVHRDEELALVRPAAVASMAGAIARGAAACLRAAKHATSSPAHRPSPP